MARAYGSSATLLLKRETAYGQAAAGDYIGSSTTTHRPARARWSTTWQRGMPA